MKNYLSAVIIFIAVFINNANAQNDGSTFPETNWHRFDTIEDGGYDSKKFKQIKSFIIDSLNTTGLIIAVDGKILFGYGDFQEQSYIASCRKSILSMLYGKYVKNNKIDLDLTLAELEIDDVHGLLPIEKQATIRNLITARSGVYHPVSNSGSDNQHAPERGSVKPGTYFLYNNWDFNAAGAIFEKLVGTSIYDALEQDIAIPIQMQDFERSRQMKYGNEKNSKYPAYHIWLSTRDMARIGLLMLNNGLWNGKQVIPADWIKTTTSIYTPIEDMNPAWHRNGHFAYGYMWWIWKSKNSNYLDDAYMASGNYGQYILVIPRLNMVIAHKTKADYKRKTSSVMFEKLVAKIINSRIE